MITIDEQVRWTIAALMSNRDCTLRDVIAVLRAAGIPRAHHACSMLLLAYGRHVLDTRGTKTSPMYVACEPGGVEVERRLADDPLFAAAREIARDGTSEEFELIGLIGGEVQAVMKAMKEGSRADELVLPASRVAIDPDDATQAQVSVPDIVETATYLMRRHNCGLDITVRIRPHQLTAKRAMLVFELTAQIGGRMLREPIASGGESLAVAYEMALEQFVGGTLPVLVATEDRDLGARVTWHAIPGFAVCSGPPLLQWELGASPDLEGYFREVLNRLVAANLTTEVHWGHACIFVDADGAVFESEMVLDNEHWQPGTELVRAFAWPRARVAYSIRHFFTLRPLRS